jgi:hypothetical protein
MTQSDQDDGFEAWLRRSAQARREPPAAPRDAMWARIEAARAAPPGDRLPRSTRGDGHRLLRAGAGLAAALAIGVGIGRYSTGTPESPAAPAQVAAAESGGRSGTPAPSSVGRVAGQSDSPAAIAAGDARATRTPSGAATRRQRTRGGQEERVDAGRPSAGGSAAYRLVTTEHLTQAESLLTSFRTETRSGRLEPQVATWARQLLATTRLLLDSPAANDPKLAKLLADLELVLAEIGRVPAGATGAEIDIIDESLERRDLVPRLKRAIPAGITPAGT